VAEIVDPETRDTVAQTWLFVTLDQNQEPVLIADNFDVNGRYPAGNNINRGIRESMFQFLRRYARACGIKKVVLGKVETNDVETGDLRTNELPPIKKLGGYFNSEKYYLETLGATKAYEI
jgi:tRNA(Ile)-lysidine synthase TilS/MesJ